MTTPILRKPRAGFTLVELLVVVAIIAILAGLITVAASRAIVTARVATIRTEINQLETALELYKQKYGEYPPDFTNAAAVTRHVQMMFPRYTGNALNDIAAAYGASDVTKLSPASALVIWLGGVPAAKGSTVPAGFNADPANPFQWGTPRIAPLMTFDTNRLKIVNGGTLLCHYYQNYRSALVPYAYFRAFTDANGLPSYTGLSWDSTTSGYTAGLAVPYQHLTASGTEWQPATYQVIACGLDGRFGTNVARTYNDATTLTTDDYDNLSNLTTGKLEDGLR
jgi:prepilin-type N-terminal cleavage/methylation domain-containing protein